MLKDDNIFLNCVLKSAGYTYIFNIGIIIYEKLVQLCIEGMIGLSIERLTNYGVKKIAQVQKLNGNL